MANQQYFNVCSFVSLFLITSGKCRKGCESKRGVYWKGIRNEHCGRGSRLRVGDVCGLSDPQRTVYHILLFINMDKLFDFYPVVLNIVSGGTPQCWVRNDHCVSS